jgi:GntR family transcriptional regulator
MDDDAFLIQPSSPEPIYRQIAAQLRRLIVGGHIAPGEEVPSVRDVAGRHAINPMTVSRAYAQLETDGLLERRRGKSMVVAAHYSRTRSPDRRMRELEGPLNELARQARELDLQPDLILARLREIMEETT